MNWDQLILRAIVPFSFVAIWALTALFNKESSKGFPGRPPGPSPSNGPRPGDPSMRWAPPAPASSSRQAVVRRVPMGDDDILIISNNPTQPAKSSSGRANEPGVRRLVKARQAAPPSKRVEPPTTRTKLAGVNQNVNQSLARPIELIPLTTIAPMATTSGSELANAPSAPSKTSAVVTVSTLRPLMSDPIRLREAFIVNELFRPPVALRGRRGHHA